MSEETQQGPEQQAQPPAQAPAKSRTWMRTVGGILVVIAVVVGMKFHNKGSASAEVHDAMATWIEAAPGYREQKALFDQLLDEAHDAAFQEAYRMGGRRTRASFDAEKYAAVLFQTMQSRATAEGHPDVARAIDAVRRSYGAAPR